MTDILQTNQANESIFKDGYLLHALIDNMPDFIYIKDTSSKFILANQRLARSHGLISGSEVIGKSDHDYYPKELADKYFQNEQEIISSGKPMIGIEEPTLDEKNQEIILSTTKIPLRDKEGKVIGIVGIGRDITNRKNAEHKLQQHAEDLQRINTLLQEKQEEIQQQTEELSAQAENLQLANDELQKLSIAISETDDVVVILDSDGNFEWANNSLERVYGLNLQQYIEKRGNNILKGSMNPDIKNILKKCRDTRRTVRYQSETFDKLGERIWVLSTLTPVLNSENNITHFVAIDADITVLKNAQDMIDQQKSQLEKANITKAKFFSIIAHDLKNPFHTILGFSELMTENFDDIDNEKKRDYLGMIYDSSRQAHTLLENLLNWSRTQTDRIKYNPVRIEVSSTITEVYRILQGSFEKKKIHFENRIPENTMAKADPNMLQTIIRNLLSNAIKFTAENGLIEVGSETIEDRIFIYVRDSGVGISEEQQKKLFSIDEFLTTKGTQGEQGTGLGLRICIDFVKKHGGELNIKSQPGEGATLSFDIHAEQV